MLIAAAAQPTPVLFKAIHPSIVDSAPSNERP